MADKKQYEVEMSAFVHRLLVTILDGVAVTGRGEGRKLARVAERLEDIPDGSAESAWIKLSEDDLQIISMCFSRACTGPVDQRTGQATPGMITGKGFRALEPFIAKLERVGREDVEGVRVFGNGSGAATADEIGRAHV